MTCIGAAAMSCPQGTDFVEGVYGRAPCDEMQFEL